MCNEAIVINTHATWYILFGSVRSVCSFNFLCVYSLYTRPNERCCKREKKLLLFLIPPFSAHCRSTGCCVLYTFGRSTSHSICGVCLYIQWASEDGVFHGLAKISRSSSSSSSWTTTTVDAIRMQQFSCELIFMKCKALICLEHSQSRSIVEKVCVIGCWPFGFSTIYMHITANGMYNVHRTRIQRFPTWLSLQVTHIWYSIPFRTIFIHVNNISCFQ